MQHAARNANLGRDVGVLALGRGVVPEELLGGIVADNVLVCFAIALRERDEAARNDADEERNARLVQEAVAADAEHPCDKHSQDEEGEHNLCERVCVCVCV